LCDPREGHGLGSSFVDALMVHAFGESLSGCESKLEYRLDEEAVAGKWPDLVVAVPTLANPTHVLLMDDVDRRRVADRRKLANLATYLRLGRARFPDAIARLLVLTNAPDGSGMTVLAQHLGPAVDESRAVAGWKLLPIRQTGEWVRAGLSSVESRMGVILSEYSSWTESIGKKWELKV
jgi:hypothetical protein